MGLKKIKLQNKEYNLSILDLLRILDPSKTGKFMNLLLKELNITDAKKYVDWILTDEAKNIINSFKVNNEQLFFYNHH